MLPCLLIRLGDENFTHHAPLATIWRATASARAFLNGGGVAVYIFLYSGFYFFTRLEITTFVPTLLYFGYMSCVSLSVFCLTGSVGLWACLKFVRSIYAAVKID